MNSRTVTVQLLDRSTARFCPFCLVQAIVPLTPEQLAEQPDDTTHVCHPGLDGCNHGFSQQEPGTHQHFATTTKRVDRTWQARCSCSWRGEQRATEAQADEDAAGHEIAENGE